MLLPIDRASDSIIRSIAVLLQNVNLPLCRAATMPPTHQIIKVMRLSLRALAPHLLLAFAEIIVRLDWFRAKLIRSCIYMEGVVSCSWVNIIIINMLVCCLNIYILQVARTEDFSSIGKHGRYFDLVDFSVIEGFKVPADMTICSFKVVK